MEEQREGESKREGMKEEKQAMPQEAIIASGNGLSYRAANFDSLCLYCPIV